MSRWELDEDVDIEPDRRRRILDLFYARGLEADKVKGFWADAGENIDFYLKACNTVAQCGANKEPAAAKCDQGTPARNSQRITTHDRTVRGMPSARQRRAPAPTVACHSTRAACASRYSV